MFPKKKELRDVRKWSRYVKRTTEGRRETYLRILEKLQQKFLGKRLSPEEVSKQGRASKKAGLRELKEQTKAIRIVSRIVVDTAISNLGLAKVLTQRQLKYLSKISVEFAIANYSIKRIETKEIAIKFSERASGSFVLPVIKLLGEEKAKEYMKDIMNLIDITEQIA